MDLLLPSSLAGDGSFHRNSTYISFFMPKGGTTKTILKINELAVKNI
jgi:hypothetical protein